MGLGIDPTVDIAFKKVFGSEDNALLLIDLLRAFIHPLGSISGVEFVQPQSEKDSPLDKQPIADIRVRDQGKRQFNIEMQWQLTPYFPKRLLYYWAVFHTEQLREGEYYQTLRPTISLCFTNQKLFPDIPRFHFIFRLQEVKRELLWTDDLEIHLIELPKFEKTPEQLSSGLDRWCYFFRHGAELDLDHLPASLDVPPIRRAMEVLTVFTQDEREREAYRQRVMSQRDHGSLLYEVELARAEARVAAEKARQDVENAQREAAAKAQEAAEKAQEAAEKAQEAAEKAQEAAEKARREAVENARQEAAEAAKRAEERGRKEGLMGQIHLCQDLLKQPRTAEVELLAMSQQDLTALLGLLRNQLLPNGH